MAVDVRALDALRRAQQDVVTRRQLRSIGVTHDHVRWQVSARRWQVAGRRVVVLHNGPLTPDQARWRTVLGQPAPAALAGITAANCFGIEGFEERRIHVVTSAHDRLSRFDDAVVHVSRRFRFADVHPARRPPTVRVERAVIDGAAWEPARRRAAALLAAAVQQRLSTATRLLRELELAGPVRHRGLLTAVLRDVADGAQSLAEIDLAPLCRRAGIPGPMRQVVRHDRRGHRYYLDADFDAFSVEIDGRPHFRVDNWVADAVRQNELVIMGERVLRVPSLLYRVSPETVVDQLRRAHSVFRHRRPA